MSEKIPTQKWILESIDEWYPVNANVVLHQTPGPGVYQLFKNPNPQDGRLGLKRLGDKFEFDFKIYDLGSTNVIDHIYNTWNSDYFEDSGRNLGVIFNGTKGTGNKIKNNIL